MTNIYAEPGQRGAANLTQAIIEGDWMERDNFSTYEQAVEYATFLSKKWPMTPYRIVCQDIAVVASFGPAAVGTQDQSRRYVVEFIIL